MYNIYDNGALMLGNIKDVISEVENEMKKDIDMCFVDQEELLKDLKELEPIADIVMINYDNPMGYTIDYWDSNDIVKQENKRYCSVCGKEMTEGYYNEDEFQYYCSDECLHKDYTDEEYNELYDEGRGNFYWTSWEE